VSFTSIGSIEVKITSTINNITPINTLFIYIYKYIFIKILCNKYLLIFYINMYHLALTPIDFNEDIQMTLEKEDKKINNYILQQPYMTTNMYPSEETIEAFGGGGGGGGRGGGGGGGRGGMGGGGRGGMGGGIRAGMGGGGRGGMGGGARGGMGGGARGGMGGGGRGGMGGGISGGMRGGGSRGGRGGRGRGGGDRRRDGGSGGNYWMNPFYLTPALAYSTWDYGYDYPQYIDNSITNYYDNTNDNTNDNTDDYSTNAESNQIENIQTKTEEDKPKKKFIRIKKEDNYNDISNSTYNTIIIILILLLIFFIYQSMNKK
jgi:hypothetical protein